MSIKRLLIATVAGGLVAYIWGMVSWMALPFHNMTLHPISGEEQVVAQLKASLPHDGVYYFPAMPMDSTPEAMEAWMDKHTEGPLALIHYHAGGMTPMSGGIFATGIFLDLLGALIAAFLLSKTAPNLCYSRRLLFVTLIGVFTAIQSDGLLWNWMNQPTDYTAVMFMDHIIKWALAGLVIAKIIQPPKEAETAS